MMNNTSIVICDQKFDIGTRVVLWDEPGGFSAYDTESYETQNRKTGEIEVVSGKRYKSRLTIGTPSFTKLKKIVTQLTFHHAGLYRNKDTFETLQQRGLSCHLLLDDDGTLHQTLDLRERAYHVGNCNAMSIGIEIASRAVAGKFPNAYDLAHQREYGVGPRRIVTDVIHGIKMKGFDYSDAQYATLIKLAKVIVSIFPLIKPDFPRDVSGNIIKTALKNPQSYQGFISHYNVTVSKIDPFALDYNRFLRGLRTQLLSVGGISIDIPPNLDTWLSRQRILISLGYDPGQPDGVFGACTESALKQFQADQGLTPDGAWGPKTEAAIRKVFGE
jgi:hypothetical protein